MKKYLYIFCCIISSISFSQNIIFDNLNSSGGNYNIENTNITFTFGQPIVGTISNTENFITQGFQQNFDEISGCTDENAYNYDPQAVTDDGSCYPVIYGCMDSTAFNYIIPTGDVMVDVNTDDNSCYPVIEGCTHQDAFNYNPIANVDDGSCIGGNIVAPYCENFDSGPPDDFLGVDVYYSNSDPYDYWFLNSFETTNPETGPSDDITGGGNYIVTYPYTYTDITTASSMQTHWDISALSNPALSFYVHMFGPTTGEVIVWVNGNIEWYLSGNQGDQWNFVQLDLANYAGSINIFVEFMVAPGESDIAFDEVCVNELLTIYGCTDPEAFNYNFNANIDDGSCMSIIEGCTDETAFNYDITANTDDGSCVAVLLGCTDPQAFNYNSSANTDDGSCVAVIYGCTNPEAFNYNSLANTDNGTCIAVVYGCMDPDAFNYNSNANIDDGSCMSIIEGCTDETAFNYDITANTDDGSCTPFVYGCTDTDAINYYPGSNSDDGSCIYLGCTDPNAFNYDITANTDDGSCVPVVYGCTDENAINYDDQANVDDGSCNSCETSAILYATSQDENSVSVEVISGFPFEDGSYNIQWYDNENNLIEDNINNQVLDNFTSTLSNACNGIYSIHLSDAVCTNPIIFDIAVTESECLIYGCTDNYADNFDPSANIEDGSCVYDEICNSFNILLISVSHVSVNGGNDGSIIATATGGSGNYSYFVYSDGMLQNPYVLSAGNHLIQMYDYETECISYLEVVINEPASSYFQCTSEGCVETLLSEGNYSSLEQCGLNCSEISPCDNIPTGLYVDNIIHNRVVFNWDPPTNAPSHYMIRYRPVGTSSWTVMTAGTVNSNEFYGTSRTRFFMEPSTTYEWNIRARVLNEDGTTNCQSQWSNISEYTTLDACANLENLSASTEAIWVNLSADVPSGDWGIWQSKGKLRVVGTNSFRYVNGDTNGNINVLKGNFDPVTDYEWHTKAWCTGNVDSDGISDPLYHSGWGEFSTFSTQEPCDKMPINLSTSANFSQTAITMSWDTPLSGEPDHYFLELTKLSTGQIWAWNNIAGSDNSKTKFGLSAGEYSWRIRGACGSNGTTWATIFSEPVNYTLDGVRLNNNDISSLNVYPNPSRKIFNIEFNVIESQDVKIEIVNVLGKVIFNEKIRNFEGNYMNSFNMKNESKGVYILKVYSNDGILSRKLTLQ